MSLARGLREVQLAGPVQVPEEMDVARPIAEALRDNAGGEALDEGCADGFVPALPVGLGVQEVRRIVHGSLCHMAVKHATFKVKTYDHGKLLLGSRGREKAAVA
jgi:hypothetical protein